MTFQLPHTKPVFKHQPDATIDVTDPVSGQKYEWKDPDENPLGTQKNVRIISIVVQCTWTVQPTPLEIHVTVDGNSITYKVTDPESAKFYSASPAAQNPASSQSLMNISALYDRNRTFLLESRSVKVEAEITGGTVSNLSARVKYAKME